jgi:hypothetical protein
MGTPNRTLKQKAYHEMKEFLVIAFYLWVMLALLLLHRSIILAEHNIADIAYQGFAIINALALAKIMLVAEYFRFGELGENKPLIYPTLVKAGAYSLLLAFFKILEDGAVGLYRGQSFRHGIAELGGGTWKGVLCLTAIVFVFLIPFFAFGEVQQVLGEGKLKELFLRPRSRVKLPDDDIDAARKECDASKALSTVSSTSHNRETRSEPRSSTSMVTAKAISG